MAAQLRVVGEDFDKDYTYQMWLEDLQGLAWNAYARQGKTIEDFAVETGLCRATVEKFIWGDTKRPGMNTGFQMARATGFRLPPIPASAPRQPDEKSLAWAREILRQEAIGKRKK